MNGRYVHLPAAAQEAEPAESALLVRLPGSAVGSDRVAAETVTVWLADDHAVESRLELLAGHRVWVHYETLTRAQAAVYAAQEAVFAAALDAQTGDAS